MFDSIIRDKLNYAINEASDAKWAPRSIANDVENKLNEAMSLIDNEL